MQVDINVHFPADPAIERKLDKILSALADLRSSSMAQYDDLKAAIADEDAEIAEVLAFVNTGLAQIKDLQDQLAVAIANQAPDLSAQIADIQSQTTALAAVLPPPAPIPTP